MEMLTVFTSVLHVSNLTAPEHFKAVLTNHNLFNDKEVQTIIKKLQGYKISLGIKKLLDLLDSIAEMEKDNKVMKFFTSLEDNGYIIPAF